MMADRTINRRVTLIPHCFPFCLSSGGERCRPAMHAICDCSGPNLILCQLMDNANNGKYFNSHVSPVIDNDEGEFRFFFFFFFVDFNSFHCLLGSPQKIPRVRCARRRTVIELCVCCRQWATSSFGRAMSESRRATIKRSHCTAPHKFHLYE